MLCLDYDVCGTNSMSLPNGITQRLQFSLLLRQDGKAEHDRKEEHNGKAEEYVKQEQDGKPEHDGTAEQYGKPEYDGKQNNT
jgi:hypothetical protein